MSAPLLIYGANGYVGEGAARLAVRSGLRPILAGRNEERIRALAEDVDCEYRVFALDEPAAVDHGLAGVAAVLHVAGPFKYTARHMVDACLRAGAHYLDINGEIPVLEDLAARDGEARRRGVMVMPGVGFDVVPTDCLAVHLHNRLPTATRLTIGLYGEGRAGAPPGTQRTAIELAPLGLLVRREGRVAHPIDPRAERMIDFGDGARRARRLTWGDIVTGFHSTGIPNIEVFAVVPAGLARQMRVLAAMRPILRFATVRRLLALAVRPPPMAEQRTRGRTHVWAEVSDPQGKRASARLHGPEAGLEWTIAAAMSVVRRVLAGDAPPGFQTPAGAYGPDLVLEVAGVTREEVS